MRKFTLAIMIALMAVFVGNAGNKLDMQGERMAKAFAQNRPVKSVDGKVITSTLTIVKFADNSVLEELEALGATIRDRRKGLAIVEMPVGILKKASELERVKYVSTPKLMKIKNDNARVASNINLVRAGIENPQNPDEKLYFDGSGVVVGLMDIGLDPNHIAFHDSDGNSRVKGITVYTGSQGNATRYTTPSEIAAFTTENEDETHGTHVLGMMAGSYTGGDNDYSGVASGSDIYVTCGEPYNYSILLGIADVCNYAQSVGKPAVVNLSLGSNEGTHDEYDLMCQYIDQIVDDYTPNPIICIAAGNEGEDDIAIIREFTPSSSSFSTTIGYFFPSYPYIVGSTEFYGDDDTPFTVTPFVYDTRNNNIVATLDAAIVTGPISGTLTPSFESLGISGYFNDYGSPLEISAEVLEGSGRFGVYYSQYMVASSSRYRLGFKVEGTPGHKVYCYHNGQYYTEFSAADNSSFVGGSGGDGTFNSMACGRRIVAVGAYNTRYEWTSINGSTYNYGSQNYYAERISPFSSWGTLWDGREMPHFVAPGCGNISSVSTYNINSTGGYAYSSTYIVRVDNINNRQQHWAVMQGTSMATPHAAGIMALWKQLIPDLTPEQAIKVAQETARNDQYTGTIQSGAGKINAYAGLLKLMESTSVESNIARNLPTVLIVGNPDGSYTITAAEADDFTAEIFNIAGAKVAAVKSICGRATIDAATFTRGAYVIAVKGEKVSHTQKIVK